MADFQHIVHPIPALFDESSEILILGSFPSVKSRAENFFYAHPQNRFWRLLASLYSEMTPQTVSEKIFFCRAHHIALWDTVYACDIIGSSDQSIKNVVPTDLSPILSDSNIHSIYCNGAAAGRFFHRLHEPVLHRKAVVLPSTSPANAARNMERLIEAWRVILKEEKE